MSFSRATFLRSWRFVLAALAAVFCLGLTPVAVWAAQLDFTPEEKAFIEAHPIVTYSDSNWRPLSNVEDGRQEGLLHDYYSLISQRTGLAFRFVDQGDSRDFQLVLDALEARRIDMIDGTGKTPDRARYALFVGPFLRFPLAIMSRDEAPAYSLATLSGKRVAVGRGGTAHEYLREHGQGLTILEASDHTEALAMVATGRADAAVENMAVAANAIRVGGLANVKISGLLDYNFEIYTLVRTDWPLLASILKKAQAAVTEQELAVLLAKWLPMYKGRMEIEGNQRSPDAVLAQAPLTLTDRERVYLDRKKALAYCIDPDWAPIERVDENGRHVGMTADFLDIMRARLGVPMVLVPTSSWSQTLAAVKDHRCDFLPAAGNTPQRRRFLTFTTPYLRFPMVVATRAKEGFIDDAAKLADKPLGVINGYASLDILRAKYPQLRLLEVQSIAEGLEMVSQGKLYGFIDIVPAISQALAKGKYGDLKIAGRLDAHLDLALATRDDEPELQSLFQKAVDSLDRGQTEAITKKWLAVTFEQGFDYALLWKVLAGAAVLLALVVWWNRKLSRLNRAIRRAHAELDQTSRRMAALLDNAGQGFLTVGPDGVVEPQYSQECRAIFGGDIAGADFPRTLYPEDEAARESLAVNIRRILAEPDDYRRQLYLSLMPKVARRCGATLRLAYRALSEGRLMFVITDVSGEERLRDAVAQERNRLACVVAAVRDQRDFFTVLDAFAAFRADPGALVAGTADGRETLDAAYRQVHTFKGLFLQLECVQAASALGELETRLSELCRSPAPDPGAVAALLEDAAVDKALARDVEVVRQALGKPFFERRGQVPLDGALADALAETAGRLVRRAEELGLEPEDVAVLRAATMIRYLDVRALLAGYPRTARRLASSQGKALAPFAIEGERVMVDPRRFDPLLKSLVHVFRNAVDHGLEMPAERDRAGKPEIGQLECRVSSRDGWLRIEVADDGRGIDVAAVRARAFESRLTGAEELAVMDEAAVLELLFRDGFSTRRQVGEISGRGVGLAAVRAEVERLGGRVNVENRPGRGMRLVLTIPLGQGQTGAGA
jgi:ABC-type amino acid transport substrate-binding protein